MKKFMPLALGISIFSMLASTGSCGENLLPGQVDFGNFSGPGSGGEFVEVNLSSSLIGLAARLVEKDEPDLARMLNTVQLVRVNVIGETDDNRADLEKRMQKIRKDLTGKGWERIVTAQKDDQNVGVYLKSSGKESLQGVVVLVSEAGRQAVFVNVVGDIKPEQLALLGEKLHIDPLKNLNHSIGKGEDKETPEEKEKDNK
jgi:Na+-translocating ferredoxin:NAD+ oxidoreductase RnfG subunit